jgi:hypothetical protein
MRIRAQITIDIEAQDFVDAADHQRRLETILSAVRADYHQAELSLRERRERAPGRSVPPQVEIVHYTGKLNTYAA